MTFLKTAKSWLRRLIFIVGTLFLLLLVISFTRLPYETLRLLGDTGREYEFTPDFIIFLGGSGMPSESNLIRLYYVHQLSFNYPQSKIILVHPSDSATISSMELYLTDQGVNKERILKMEEGRNTREQAMELKKAFPQLTGKKIVLVTSPENMYRTIKTFKNLDFINVGGESAYENAMYISLEYNYRKLGGKKYLPDVSSYQGIRYDFWNYLKLEITCLREFTAIIYYKINGWI